MFFSKASLGTRQKAHKIGEAFFNFVRERLEDVGPQFSQNIQLYGYLHAVRTDGLRRFAKSEKDAEKAFKELMTGFGNKFNQNYEASAAKAEMAASLSDEERDRNGDMAMFFHGFMAGFVAAQIDLDEYESNGYSEFKVEQLEKAL